MHLPQICIVLPAYNEQDALIPLLKSIENWQQNLNNKVKVLVVNDGSTDDTENTALQFKNTLDIEVLNNSINSGLGFTLKKGLKHACNVLNNDDDVVVTMDADNTHHPDLISEMLKQLKDGADLVIASRYQKGAKVIGLPLFREFLSIGVSWLFRIFQNYRNVKDYTSGYRAYKVGFLQKSFTAYGDGLIVQKGFSCMAEILLKLIKLKPSIGEVPLILRYDAKIGESKMKIVKTIFETFKLVLQKNTNA